MLTITVNNIVKEWLSKTTTNTLHVLGCYTRMFRIGNSLSCGDPKDQRILFTH
ncbi:Uncharacterised protein [Vibrio cholerae]|nr:Uncharacterised protein [Vibrio cholerae]CSI55147.1 Uncharacterised protein [Vibrio cholerae]